MYPHQAERLAAALESAGLDALVATSPANVRYVTGFSSVAQAVDPAVPLFGVVTRQRTALVLPAIDAPAAAADGVETDVVIAYGPAVVENRNPRTDAARLREWTAPAAATAGAGLAAALDALGVRGRIGLDEGGLSAPAWREVNERLTSVSVHPGTTALAGARAVKGPYEIECLDRATRIAEEGVNAVLQLLKPGVTEREAVVAYDAEVVRRGGVPHGARVLMGERAALPAAHPSERALRIRDLVRFDVGCAVNGYRAALARTAVMGEPDERQTTVHEAVMAGVEAAVAACRPGAPASAVFEAAVGAVRASGLTDYRCHGAGHGIGLSPEETPWLTPAAPAAFEMGMVVMVETPYYEYAWGGVGLKETLLVTNVGARSVNRSARGLVVLD